MVQPARPLSRPLIHPTLLVVFDLTEMKVGGLEFGDLEFWGKGFLSVGLRARMACWNEGRFFSGFRCWSFWALAGYVIRIEVRRIDYSCKIAVGRQMPV